VIGLVLFLLREQEVAGSNPVALTELKKASAIFSIAEALFVQSFGVSLKVILFPRLLARSAKIKART
jgi:hypothetical protein